MTTTMLIDRIECDFREKVSDDVRLIAEGTGRYQVFAPFCFKDGDHLTILLKQNGTRWFLSDEAHTYMRISFDIDVQELLRGPRQKIIAKTLAEYGIEDRDGELLLEPSDEQYGDALNSLIQALLTITESGRPEVMESLAPHSSSLPSQE